MPWHGLIDVSGPLPAVRRARVARARANMATGRNHRCCATSARCSPRVAAKPAVTLISHTCTPGFACRRWPPCGTLAPINSNARRAAPTGRSISTPRPIRTRARSGRFGKTGSQRAAIPVRAAAGMASRMRTRLPSTATKPACAKRARRWLTVSNFMPEIAADVGACHAQNELSARIPARLEALRQVEQECGPPLPGIHASEPGTSDARVWSETGCTCVLSTSLLDELR